MNKKAFSLIELIIVISLLGLVLSSSLFFWGAHLKTYRHLEDKLAKEQITERIFLLISKDIKNCLEYKLVSPSEINLRLKSGWITYGIKDQKIKRKSGERTDYLSMPDEVSSIGFKIIDPKVIELEVGKESQSICSRNLL
ncbi:MAG: prepilin-type N-terminal cleavage/methylation domain-containing protein [Candidatus Saganbacteria bacterium]|nr:prepilin-type N-terminal cleavage/methylation domain-containing protein [Candidatus Saganbacteria bacterium]